MSAELDRVREYREAARLAVRADAATFQSRCLALIDLAESARNEPDPLIRTWGERAIWEEAKSFLGMDDEQHDLPGEPFERAQRRLRDQGLVSCPTCRSVLATDADFDRWRRTREQCIADTERREGAVG